MDRKQGRMKGGTREKGRRRKGKREEGWREGEKKGGIEAGGKGSLIRTRDELKESRSLIMVQCAKKVLSSSSNIMAGGFSSQACGFCLPIA